jgi:hypothetical protein
MGWELITASGFVAMVSSFGTDLRPLMARLGCMARAPIGSAKNRTLLWLKLGGNPMIKLATGIAVIGLVGALALGGCATTESVKHAQETADHAQGAADQALSGAQAATTAAQKAQAAADQNATDVHAVDAKLDQLIAQENAEKSAHHARHLKRHHTPAKEPAKKP